MSSPSGADLARTALAAAKAAARQRGTTAAKPKRLAPVKRGAGRDPQRLGDTLGQVVAANGWDTAAKAGSITDRWASIAPTDIADQVRPEHYDPQRRVLHLRPATQAAASMLRLTGAQLATTLNQRLGQDLIAAIKVLPVQTVSRRPDLSMDKSAGSHASSRDDLSMDKRRPAVGAGAPPSLAMRDWLTQHRQQRAHCDATAETPRHPLFADAYGHLREDPAAFHPAAAVIAEEHPETQAQRSAASHARALAAARTRRRTGDPTPLSAIPVARAV
jgi:hypothetical protein